MSDDESGPAAAPVEQGAPAASPAPSSNASTDALAKKFRTIPGEEILTHMRPSFFGFLGYYVIAVVLLVLHWLFDGDRLRDMIVGPDGGWLMSILGNIIDSGVTFTGVLLTLTWFNRMMNGHTSNRWLTSWLLLASLAPMLTVIDNSLSTFLGDSYPSLSGDMGLLPDYNHMVAGLFFAGMLVVLTAWYQRSFHYAITSDAVIFDHRFLLRRGNRRILFEKISEVLISRSMTGTLMGYATITLLTDSGLGLGEESRGMAAGSAPAAISSSDDDSAAEKAGKGILRRMIGLLFYQRTVTTVDPDPKHCFYNVGKAADVKQQLDELHKRHSQSSQIADLRSALESKA